MADANTDGLETCDTDKDNADDTAGTQKTSNRVKVVVAGLRQIQVYGDPEREAH